jgi:TetR/AcrR family transcriptional repressor of nem operon
VKNFEELRMRYSAEHKELTRKKILDAAARRFRAEGYDGLGIDGLAKAAGVTNGAFYGHFESKADAFRAVAVEGLVELREGIERYRAKCGDNWLADFTRFYFSAPKIDCPENICALPSFAPEMARAPKETQAAFQRELAAVVRAVAYGLRYVDATVREEKAWTILTLLAGGVTLARSIGDTATQAGMLAGLEQAVLAVGQTAPPLPVTAPASRKKRKPNRAKPS